MSRPICLFVTLMRLEPAWQGNAKRAMQLVRLYREAGYDIHLLYHAEEGFDEPSINAYNHMFDQVFIVRQSCLKEQRGEVFTLDEWYDDNLTGFVATINRRYNYDVIHANYVWYGPLFERLRGDFVGVLDTHDIFAERHLRYIEAGMQPQWFYTSIAEENRALSATDVVLAIQDKEAQEFRQRGFDNVVCLPFMDVSLSESSWAMPVRVFDDPVVIGYLASANDWNISSIRDFAAAVEKLEEPPDFRLLIGGAVSQHLPRDTAIKRLSLLDHIDDITAFYSAIDIALNPMIGGTGLKIKTIEALQFGKPVLSTLDGMTGLESVWRLPVFDSNEELLAFLVERMGGQGPDQMLEELGVQASDTVDALSDEITTRTADFLNRISAASSRSAA